MSANSSFRRRSVTLISLRPLRGSKAMSTLAIPLRSYSKSTRCGLLGLEASGSLTSANSWQGLSSKHTTGLCGS
jgi:hypothetical protein